MRATGVGTLDGTKESVACGDLEAFCAGAAGSSFLLIESRRWTSMQIRLAEATVL